MAARIKHHSKPTIETPQLADGHGRPLTLSSTLQDLPLYRFCADIRCAGREVAHAFEAHLDLPGVVLLDKGSWVGMISRSQFLEYLLRPHGAELFLEHSLKVLHSYVRTDCLVLSGDTSILAAAQEALHRPIPTASDPIVVEVEPGEYRLLDAQQLNQTYWQLRTIETQVWYERMQVQMIRSDKMASLGRLVDGVSHEILDPVSFIWGNLSHLSGYIHDLCRLVDAYEAHVPQPPADIITLREDVELDYLREDMPKTLESIKTGADRLSKLATSLQNFCHIDEVYPKPADIHDCLDGVLLLLKSRLKGEIEVIKHYGHLPPVNCFIGQVTQVFLNIFSQFLDRLLTEATAEWWLDDRSALEYFDQEHPKKPCIRIVTEACSIDGSGTRWIAVRIGSNARPMALEEQQQLIASFACPQVAAKETSLVTSYRIITNRHKGIFRVRSRANPEDILDTGINTEFEILIPLA